MSDYLINNIMKYRAAGGTFRKGEDLQKIYGMDSTVYAALAGCIALSVHQDMTAQPRRAAKLDINTADMDTWKSLPGIGDTYARRIINFRNHLGGFHSIDQVSETYGLPVETFEAIREKLVMSSGLKQIDINTASVEDFAGHPYITHEQAETIVNFRNHHGVFAQVDDLMHIYSLNTDWLSRIRHYLSCDAAAGIHADIAAR